jgi:hypothetical protein
LKNRNENPDEYVDLRLAHSIESREVISLAYLFLKGFSFFIPLLVNEVMFGPHTVLLFLMLFILLLQSTFSEV